MAGRVLILGGYGNFGKYISRSLLRQNIPVVLAGRNEQSLNKQKNNLSRMFNNKQIQTIKMDVDENNIQKLKRVDPKVVINTCGPFQLAAYRIVQDCIDAGTNYIDLADGRKFIKQMSQFNQRAKERNVTVITGASSVPGLSSAVIQKYKNQFRSIEKLQYGITPGQRTNRGGVATIRGVMGYIGKPIEPFGDLKQPVYGWQDLYMQKYPQIGTRLFGNCQIPDLDIFPQKYGIKSLRFSAGTQNKFLHLGVWLTSWLVRLGVPLNLPKYSQFLLNASHTLFDPLGSDEGGMHMTFIGTNKQNKKMVLRWFIIVRKGHGPNVPVIPAVVLAKKIISDNYSLPGVHSCTGLVSLQQYLNQMKDFQFSTYQQRQLLQK